MIKRVLTMVLVLGMLLTSTGVETTPAASTVTASDGYVTSEDGRFRYEVFETEEENYIYIEKYLGNETEVVIPDTMDGYVVRGLYTSIMHKNTTVEEIEIPNTLSYIQSGAFGAAYALKRIHMEDGFEEAFHTEDGILYNGGTLHSYPSGKEEKVFVIPNGTGKIHSYAFYGCVNLEKVIVPDNIEFIINPFSRCKKTLDIVIKKDTYEAGYLDEVCWQMLEGTRFLVANEELAEQYAAEMTDNDYYAYTYNDSQYYEIDKPMAVEVYEPVPATDLTFADGSKSKDITVTYNPEAETLNTDLYEAGKYVETDYLEFMEDFIQYPSDTTENLKWNYEGDECFKGSIAAVGITGGGNFTVTGYDESGHEIVANITVLSKMDEFSLDEASVELEAGKRYTLEGSLHKSYSWAFTKGATWELEDDTIAEIADSGKEKSGYDEVSKGYYELENGSYGRIWCTLNGIEAGETTLSATVYDNGEPVTKSVQVKVTDSIENCVIDEIPAQEYTGGKIMPKPVVRYKDRVLEEGADYELEYKTNTYREGTVIVKGMGLFKGSQTVSFDIMDDIANTTVNAIPDQNKSEFLSGTYPEVTVRYGSLSNGFETLVEGTDYTLEYGTADNNLGYVDITGTGEFSGVKTVYFQLINDAASCIMVTDDMVTIGAVSYPKYQKVEKVGDTISPVYTTGMDILNTLSVKDGEKELVLNTDYSISLTHNGGLYSMETKKMFAGGDYELSITGIQKAGYTGTTVVNFSVYDNYRDVLNQYNTENGITTPGNGGSGGNGSGTGSNGNGENSGTVSNPGGNDSNGNENTPAISTVTKTTAVGSKAFSASTVITITGKASYTTSNRSIATVNTKGRITPKKAGYAEITVTDTTGTRVIRLYVVPKKAKLIYALSTKKKSLSVKWKKDKTVSGYEVEYSVKKNFKNSVKVDVPKNKKTSVKIKNLKSKKKYYVRVKGYIVIDGVKYYGAASEKKRIKTR